MRDGRNADDEPDADAVSYDDANAVGDHHASAVGDYDADAVRDDHANAAHSPVTYRRAHHGNADGGPLADGGAGYASANRGLVASAALPQRNYYARQSSCTDDGWLRRPLQS